MAKPLHTRILLNGYFGDSPGVETWQFGFSIPEHNPGTNLARAQLAQRALELYDAYIHGPYMLPWTKLQYARVEAVNADGTIKREPDGQLSRGDYVPATAIAGAVDSDFIESWPPQLALCVSLHTARVGATGKGRFYLPMPGFQVADGRLAAASAQTMADKAAQFLNAFNDESPESVHVMSSKGFSSRVTQVRVGRAVDTQRSRRSSLVEEYKVSAIT